MFETKKIMVRADGNAKIGLGHIMRSMAIMTVLREWGWQCLYVCSAPAPVDLIRKNGFEVMELDYPYAQKTLAEAGELLRIMKERGIGKILIDSYFVTDEYFEALRKCVKTIYMNSLERKFPVDLLINESIACDKEFFHNLYQGTDTVLLLGKEYVPLRKEFRLVSYEARERVERILLMTGGGDQYNFMGQFLSRIKKEQKYAGLSFLCVSGLANSHHEELLLAAEGMERVRVVHGAGNMAELMAESDIALSAGGTSMFELSAVGVPTIAFSVASDQVACIRYLSQCGVLVSAGEITSGGFWDGVFFALDDLIADVNKRKRMSDEAKKQFDGRGTERIAKGILEL